MRLSSLLITMVMISFFSISGVAAAAEPQFSTRYNQCINQSGGADSRMIECNDAETKLWDRRLNVAYPKVLARLTKSRQDKLRNLQRIWIQYRDANCDFANDPDAGTMARLEASSCILTMTAQRTTEMEDLVR